MRRTTLCVILIAGLGCVAALSAGTAAAASSARPSLIVFTVQNLGDASASCPGSLFGLSFDMQLGRATLGTGLSCVRSVEGCQMAGCKQTIGTTFTLDFRRGTLTIPTVLHETWLTDAKVFTRDSGTVSSGTGVFAGASGTLNCVGTIDFTTTATLPRLVCLVRLD
jgi:hypothetical protein